MKKFIIVLYLWIYLLFIAPFSLYAMHYKDKRSLKTSTLFLQAARVIIKKESEALISNPEKFLHLHTLFEDNEKEEECAYSPCILHYLRKTNSDLLTSILIPTVLLTTCCGDTDTAYFVNRILNLPNKKFMKLLFIPKENKLLIDSVANLMQEGWVDDFEWNDTMLVRTFKTALAKLHLSEYLDENQFNQLAWLHSLAMHCPLLNASDRIDLDNLFRKKFINVGNVLKQKIGRSCDSLIYKISNNIYINEKERYSLFLQAFNADKKGEAYFWFNTGLLPIEFFPTILQSNRHIDRFLNLSLAFQKTYIPLASYFMKYKNLLDNFFKVVDDKLILEHFCARFRTLKGFALKIIVDLFYSNGISSHNQKRIAQLRGALRDAIKQEFYRGYNLTNNQLCILMHPSFSSSLKIGAAQGADFLIRTLRLLYMKEELFSAHQSKCTYQHLHKLLAMLKEKMMIEEEYNKVCSSFFKRTFSYYQGRFYRAEKMSQIYEYSDELLVQILSIGQCWEELKSLFFIDKKILHTLPGAILHLILEQENKLKKYAQTINILYKEEALELAESVCKLVLEEIDHRKNFSDISLTSSSSDSSSDDESPQPAGLKETVKKWLGL